MRKQNWAKRDPIKNYFPLPNEIYALGLSSTAIAVYGYLLHREDRKTYQCLASYRMIGEAIPLYLCSVPVVSNSLSLTHAAPMTTLWRKPFLPPSKGGGLPPGLSLGGGLPKKCG